MDDKLWIHKVPAMTQQVYDQRKHLLQEKETALNKSTNLFVSRTRMTIRNLPKRDFFEKELKELIMLVVDEWMKTLTPEQKKQASQKKLVKQVKVLRDKEKVDALTKEKLSNGIGFAEVENEELAKYAIMYLNNMELVTNKGLIVDYSLEDAR